VVAHEVVGEVKGRVCVLIDDMIDTAGTVCAAAELLKERGASTVYSMATHAILSDPAVERLQKSAIDKVVVSDTLPIPKEKLIDKIEVVSVAPIIADAVAAIFYGQSVSKLFAGDNQM
jgi:ribose-phosphate pyrophosphokinase